MKDVVIVNLGALDADPRITDAMEITKELLKDLWYIKSATAFVKLLWQGDYAKHLTFKDIDAFSAGAKTKMEKPWTTHSVSRKAPAKIVKNPKSKVWKLKIKTADEKKTVKSNEIAKQPAPKKAAPVKAEKLIEVKAEKKTVEKKPAKKAVEKKEPAAKKPAAKKPATKKTK